MSVLCIAPKSLGNGRFVAVDQIRRFPRPRKSSHPCLESPAFILVDHGKLILDCCSSLLFEFLSVEWIAVEFLLLLCPLGFCSHVLYLPVCDVGRELVEVLVPTVAKFVPPFDRSVLRGDCTVAHVERADLLRGL